MVVNSSTKHAPTSLEDLKSLLAPDNKVKVAGCVVKSFDVDGVLRGKFMSKEKFLSAASSDGFGFCSVIFGWDLHDAVYSRELLISNSANGYRDLIASIDLSTYRRIPWENNVPFFLVSFLDPETRAPVSVCPRGVLKRVLSKGEQYGWQCLAGVEFEYFQFKETPHSLVEKKFSDLQPLTPGMHGYSLLRTQLNNDYFHDIFNEADKFDIDIEGHHTETGPGVFETALAYNTALRMADNALLFKYLVKSLGMKYGITPSFMAKPWGNLPGCSGHIHVSIRDNNGDNVFAVKPEELKRGREGAAYDELKYISQSAEYFLAGVLHGLTDVMPALVPTINGYKRLSGGEAFWAPNAVTFGYDSRAASVRVISPPSVPAAATRFEIRVTGADVNPFFALSAILGLGIRGVEKKLALPVAPVSSLSLEDKKTGKIPMLPLSLEAATAKMVRPDSVAREIFGDEFVDHFCGTREHEIKLWNEAVTSWEVERYLELA
ncbi:glutamine synthetase/guanido kinase [Lactarius akahatsu]|uniref:Glutamine synthetase/guanido kinase n=1 Tax=Lactarius akahatsu TaxID=416441 RepID=A0AAD4LRJ0_9AGAM|nr:glutamine synthetase/guanido kinase [Lactarius akahatsu]